MAEIKNEDLEKLVTNANKFIHKDPRLKQFEGKLEVTEAREIALETIKAIAELSISYRKIGIDRTGQEHFLGEIIGDVLTMFGDPRGVKPKGYKADSKDKDDKSSDKDSIKPRSTRKVKCPSCGHEFNP